MRVVGLAVLALLVPVVTAAQSLEDAAQKEKERRKKVQQSGASSTVIGDEALKSNRGTLANDPKAPPAVTSSKDPAAKASPTPALPDRRQEEAAWRSRVAQAEERLSEARKRYEMLNGLSLVSGEYYVDEDGKPLVTSLEQLRKMIGQAKEQVDAAQKSLDSILESARQQGVPPGWLR
jgi:hypothetical protein